jgi:hypothetical protein
MNNNKIKIKQYSILLDKLKIHCVKEHVLSFLTGFNDTIETQIVKHKNNIQSKTKYTIKRFGRNCYGYLIAPAICNVQIQV